MKPRDACRHLENKAYFLLPSAGEPEEPDRPCSTPFWCARTLQSIGPDECDVTDECCGADRADRPCYQPEVDI